MNSRLAAVLWTITMLALSGTACNSPSRRVTAENVPTSEVREVVSTLSGVERIDTFQVKYSTWRAWRTQQGPDPIFDGVEQPIGDNDQVFVIGVTGHIEPLVPPHFGPAQTDWAVIVLSLSYDEIQRSTGDGNLPTSFLTLK